MSASPPKSVRRITLARVMLWIACAAVFLASVRNPNSLASIAFGTVALAVLEGDIMFTLFRVIVGAGPRIGVRRVPQQPVQTLAELWAVVDGFPIKVELTASDQGSDAPVDLAHVGDCLRDGRSLLVDFTQAEAEPLNLMDRGPVTIRHEVYGVCLVSPILARVGVPAGSPELA